MASFVTFFEADASAIFGAAANVLFISFRACLCLCEFAGEVFFFSTNN